MFGRFLPLTAAMDFAARPAHLDRQPARRFRAARREMTGGADLVTVVVSARDELTVGLAPAPKSVPVEWRISRELVPYEAALASMETRAGAIAEGAPLRLRLARGELAARAVKSSN